jgi:hypothetical protein
MQEAAVAELTRPEAKCVEAMAYLAPGGWQPYRRLDLTGRAKEGALDALAARGLVERRLSVIYTGRGLARGPGEERWWRLTPAGWALARSRGWGWPEGDEEAAG